MVRHHRNQRQPHIGNEHRLDLQLPLKLGPRFSLMEKLITSGLELILDAFLADHQLMTTAHRQQATLGLGLSMSQLTPAMQ